MWWVDPKDREGASTRRHDKILPLHHYQRKLKAERRTDAAEVPVELQNRNHVEALGKYDHQDQESARADGDTCYAGALAIDRHV